jgi:hypothetical protein
MTAFEFVERSFRVGPCRMYHASVEATVRHCAHEKKFTVAYIIMRIRY